MGGSERVRPNMTDFSAIEENETKSVTNDIFFHICDRKQIFSGFRTKICYFKICQIWQILNSDRLQIFSGFLAKICLFWQILTAKSVILKSVKFDRFCCKKTLARCVFVRCFLTSYFEVWGYPRKWALATLPKTEDVDPWTYALAPKIAKKLKRSKYRFKRF